MAYQKFRFNESPYRFKIRGVDINGATTQVTFMIGDNDKDEGELTYNGEDGEEQTTKYFQCWHHGELIFDSENVQMKETK